MGNMSNPTVTRLGSMQLWYKHWYSDTLMPTNLQHDKMFQKLIRVYLDYGFIFQTSIFMSDYWYRTHRNSINTNLIKSSITQREQRLYYRKYYYENSEMSVTHSYKMRVKTPEYFPSRTWFIKYMRWVIVCVRWYKPWKAKRKKRVLSKAASGVNVLAKPTEQYYLDKKLGVVISWLKNKLVGVNNYSF